MKKTQTELEENVYFVKRYEGRKPVRIGKGELNKWGIFEATSK